MRLQVLSDLHLEHNLEYNVEYKDEDYLILAGDIHVYNSRFADKTGYTSSQDNWFVSLLEHRDVIYILGNHEYYGADFNTAIHYVAEWTENINVLAKEKGYKHELIFLENDSLTVSKDDKQYTFIGATMWTNFDNEDPKLLGLAPMYMNDYRVIKNISPDKVLGKNKESLAAIEEELSLAKGKKIVITHHACSHLSTDEKFKGNILNGLFMSHFDTLVKKADVWIHGHVHDRFDYMIDNCRVVVNPYGYVHEWKEDYTGKVVDI